MHKLRTTLENAYPNTMHGQLNDAFETYFPLTVAPIRIAYLGLTAMLLLGLRLRKWIFGGRLLVNERIVEYPRILRWIRPGGSVLDIGCVPSRFLVQLASLGYEVQGLDVRPYPFEHPNFRFHQEDLFKWKPGRSFDTIILVSILEHLGMGDHGDLVLPDADVQAVAKVSRWLPTGGHLLVSVPFGKAGVTRIHRIYDLERLQKLFSAFSWTDQRYYRRIDGHWMPSSSAELAEIESPSRPCNGVALLSLQKDGLPETSQRLPGRLSGLGWG